ncbi:MAG: glucosyltransferase domain-containing protein [Clostridia bacterium]|nr:glucosyltransferase domain-containing protein [Clostridia bacterium]
MSLNKSEIKKCSILLLINFIILLLSFGPYVIDDYMGIDDYIFSGSEWMSEMRYNLTVNGRGTALAAWEILSRIGINPIRHSSFLNSALIIIMAISTELIAYDIYKRCETRTSTSLIVLDVLTLLIFSNAFFNEWFYFKFASVQWILCIANGVIAVLFFDEDRMKCLASLLFLIISVNAYQVGVCLFFSFVLVKIYCEEGGRFNLYAIKKITRAIVVIGVSLLSNLLWAKYNIPDDYITRYNHNGFSLIEAINKLTDEIKLIFLKGDRLYPGFALTIVPIIGFIILGVVCKHEKKYREFIDSIVFFLLILLSTFAPTFFTQTQYTIRTEVSLFIALLCPFIFSFVHINNTDVVFLRYLKRTIVVAMISVEMMTLLCSQKCIKTLNIVNLMDRKNCEYIQQAIQKYEDETGTEVLYVGVDRNVDYEIADKGMEMFGKSGFSTSWSDVYMIGYYSGNTYKYVQTDYSYGNKVNSDGRDIWFVDNYAYVSLQK